MKAIYFFLFSLCLQAATAQPLQRVAPEQVGMDSRKLMYADEAIETAISNKDIPGAVLAVVRNGKMVLSESLRQQAYLSQCGAYDCQYYL